MEPWPIEFDTGRPAWIGIRSIPSPAAVPSLNPSDFGDPPEDDLLPNHLCQIDRETWRVGASWSEASFCLFLPWGNPHETPMKCYEIIGQPQPNPMFVRCLSQFFFLKKIPRSSVGLYFKDMDWALWRLGLALLVGFSMRLITQRIQVGDTERWGFFPEKMELFIGKSWENIGKSWEKIGNPLEMEGLNGFNMDLIWVLAIYKLAIDGKGHP